MCGAEIPDEVYLKFQKEEQERAKREKNGKKALRQSEGESYGGQR